MDTFATHPVINELINRIHAEDTDGFLALFTADGYVDDWGRVFTGPDQIRAWSDVEFIGAQGRMTNIDETGHDHTVTITTDWVSNHHTGPSRFEFHLDNDHISAMTITEA